MRRQIILLLLVVLALTGKVVSVEIQDQIVTASCSTGPTSLSGERDNCDEDGSTFTAPPGLYLSQNNVSGGSTGGAGSEHSCSFRFGDWVELMPEVTQPRSVTVHAHARSHGGHGSPRGWSNCKYTFKLVKP